MRLISEGPGVNEQQSIEEVWLQMKDTLVNNAKEVCGCVKIGGGRVNSELWNHEVEQAVSRKKGAWNDVLKAVNEFDRESCIEIYRRKKRLTKRCLRDRRREINEQFGKKMSEDVKGNSKLFWKEVRKLKKEEVS